ncbi:uncharacterized protein PV09_09270 [Verruconis gallopava]|uniref:Major facilitator superfamily (MFS) profile domain-containing protein n=1 Tax=Verruconis gallopava TaxID=253628 RepID=A0A0D1XA10_9PEZI|nr:uncharacterized protein PV09_09270 [Verruconis gallopava]KIV98990.1 hypothetical protein PV09_09270 [Verruconis gallopava]
MAKLMEIATRQDALSSTSQLELLDSNRSQTWIAGDPAQVVGTTNLYQNGQVRCIPMPSPDPKDPLNLPTWRKVAAIVSVCFFGALALSAETIIGALTPVFALEYAGINPMILGTIDISKLGPPGVVDLNPLKLLAGLGGPPLWKISFLSTLPLLTNGISNYLLVPLSISIGRRPVMLACGVLAWSGGFAAGMSRSLNTHIAARCVQGVGAGAVEALIPLIVQDLVFIHQRNRAMSSIWAAQGLIIVSIGIASPVMVVTPGLGWRTVYFMTAGIAVGAWLSLCFFLPETRWTRSPEELAGKSVYHLEPGENRPRLDTNTYSPRTTWTNFGVFQNGFENKQAAKSMLDTLRTMLFPTVLWVVAINSGFISVQNAAAQTASSVLIAAGWKFRNLGLAVVPIVVATPFVALLGGYVADKVSNAMAKRNGGRREAETHLINAIFPLLCGIAGCFLFGYGGQHITTVHWPLLLGGIFLIAVGFLTVNTVLAVYIVESYPQWAGPVLVNVSSFRCVVGFAMSFRATTWVEQRGFFGSFAIYAGVLAALTALLPLFYFYGKRFRQWTAGTIQNVASSDERKDSYMDY